MPKSKTYEEFVEKFKPKKTTDDCMTPPEIYNIVRDWACKEYGIDPARIVRPFWPGGDYETFDYSCGAVVLDNPPFSIFSKICKFYLDRKIPFFLFAPSLTMLSGRAVAMQMNHIICNADITYENGAIVRTAFVTNFGGDIVLQTAPELTRTLNAEMKKLKKAKTKTLLKYDYPDNVVTTALMQRYSKYGINWKIRRLDCCFIPALDTQREKGKTIFGGGLLLSNRAAAEHAVVAQVARRKAAERANAYKWELSNREREIVETLGDKDVQSDSREKAIEGLQTKHIIEGSAY